MMWWLDQVYHTICARLQTIYVTEKAPVADRSLQAPLADDMILQEQHLSRCCVIFVLILTNTVIL